jgi:4-aminobutyrate aminotransferase-like enzyme
MLTGFGRTGKMWGCDHEPLVPDVIAVGKGMGGGFPVSGVISTQELMASKPFGNPSGSSSSYGGNPLAATAGLATLEVILEERLVANARHVGAVMLKRLEAIKDKYPFVGDVRGRGLLIGIELVRDRKTKEPLPKSLTRKLFASCLQRGLLAMCYSYNIRINPPLTITEEQALEGLAILEEAFAELAGRPMP